MIADVVDVRVVYGDEVIGEKRSRSLSPVVRRKRLVSEYFSVASKERAAEDKMRIAEEWMDNMEKNKLEQEAQEERERTKKKKEDVVRQQACRARKKEAEIASGKRDRHGKNIKSLHLISEPASSIEVAEASRPKRQFVEDLRQGRTDVGRPRVKVYKAAVLTNWMTPLLWSIIERTAKRLGPRMGASEIARELQRTDPVLFKKIAPQTVGSWIDRTGVSPKWSQKTLECVTKGNRPGGLTTRVGILVHCICLVLIDVYLNK